MAAPHLLDVEVLSALRGLLRAGKLEPARAEALGAPLYTCGAKLDSGGHGADVRVFPRTL